jgi:hemoglobin-like flavoprotein
LRQKELLLGKKEKAGEVRVLGTSHSVRQLSSENPRAVVNSELKQELASQRRKLAQAMAAIAALQDRLDALEGYPA